jgi:hypothetical protein
MYHLIFVCKYRKKLLIGFGEEIKNMIYYISDETQDLYLVSQCLGHKSIESTKRYATNSEFTKRQASKIIKLRED